MELRHLRSFLAVADTLHFRRAAKQLNLTQPTLSQQIKAIEEEMGVQLLTRNRVETALTYAGAIFQKEVRELLARTELGVERAQQAAQGIAGRVRVGFISTAAAAHVLPPLIARFRETHPEIELTLENMLTSDQVAMLEAGSLDVGFLRLPVTAQEPLEVIPIFKEPLVLFLPEADPLAHKRNLRLIDLRQSSFVVYSRSHAPGYHDLILRILNDAGFSPVIAQEAGEMYTLVSLVSAGLGVALAPISAQSYRLPGIVARRVPGLPMVEIALGYRRDLQSHACRLFVELALELHRAGHWGQ
jgi:DNA-binding transcriptional LysR family regulator